jgi:hypothetical protein
MYVSIISSEHMIFKKYIAVCELACYTVGMTQSYCGDSSDSYFARVLFMESQYCWFCMNLKHFVEHYIRCDWLSFIDPSPPKFYFNLGLMIFMRLLIFSICIKLSGSVVFTVNTLSLF